MLKSLVTRSIASGLAFVLAACSISKEPQFQADPASFKALQGWEADDHAAALVTFQQSCAKLLKKKAEGPLFKDEPRFGSVADWQRVCRAADTLAPKGAKAFFEQHFKVLALSDGGKSEGLFTGYYEPELRGSLTRQGPYQYPLYKRPSELVMVNLGQFAPDLKGRRIAGFVKGGQLKPFVNRADIETDGALEGRDLEIAYVDNPVDAFFLHVQGSGRVKLLDGSILRVGYAGQNGHAYVSIGKVLIDRGEVPREKMSMQAIRSWIAENPDSGQTLMQENPSFVFFRELKGPGPLGSQGVALTPGRSLAVDRRFYPMGLPLWLDAVLPAEKQGEKGQVFQRLMVAQDTGGAIRGIVRGDVFWGAGDEAIFMAGHMKQRGTLFALIPLDAEKNRAPNGIGD